MPRAHFHRPWRIARWTITGESTVTWALIPSTCPACPECGGRGGHPVVFSDGTTDMSDCGVCLDRRILVRIPAWLNRILPGPPLHWSAPFPATMEANNVG